MLYSIVKQQSDNLCDMFPAMLTLFAVTLKKYSPTNKVL